MQIGKVILAATALGSLLAGALVEGQRKPESLPLKLFSQAKHSDFVGDSKCAACHSETAKTFPDSPHAIYVSNTSLPIDKQGCESCHGPALVHTDEQDPGKQIIAYSKISPK